MPSRLAMHFMALKHACRRLFFSLVQAIVLHSARARRRWEGGRNWGRGRTQIAFRKKTMRSKPPKKKVEIEAPPRAMPGAATAAAVASHLLAVAAALHAAGKFTRVPLLGEKKNKKRTIPAKAGASAERCVECRTIDEPPSLCWLQIKVGDSGCLQRQEFLCGKNPKNKQTK